MICYHCPPPLWMQKARQWNLADLLAHVQAEHPEQVAAGMPECPNCGMPCEPSRHPQDGWLCRYCGLWADQRVCPTCRSVVHRSRLPRAAAATS